MHWRDDADSEYESCAGQTIRMWSLSVTNKFIHSVTHLHTDTQLYWYTEDLVTLLSVLVTKHSGQLSLPIPGG